LKNRRPAHTIGSPLISTVYPHIRGPGPELHLRSRVEPYLKSRTEADPDGNWLSIPFQSPLPALIPCENDNSVTGLYGRIREDEAHHPDTINRRFGDWARLLSLFRLVWSGAHHGGFRVPVRKGYPFGPDRYPFLGRCQSRQDTDVRIPLVLGRRPPTVCLEAAGSDGEQLSYRNLDIEQIGETVRRT
jgi:hypothetical protein